MDTTGPFDISSKVVLVTGAAKGIGLGICRRFVESGARVLLVDHDEHGLKQAMGGLGGAGKAAWMVQDVAAENAGEAMVARVVREFGRLDVLVNNAGIFPMVPILQMTSELWDKVHRLNLRGLAFACQAAGRQMVRQGQGGRIINIASIDSVHPSMVGLGAYDASKGGVLSFTKSFALEMAPHRVHVNAIEPGGIATPGASKPLEGSGMSPQQMKEMSDNFIKNKVPLGRMGEPDDIAKVALFLASEGASYMTGAAVLVDGGALLA